MHNLHIEISNTQEVDSITIAPLSEFSAACTCTCTTCCCGSSS